MQAGGVALVVGATGVTGTPIVEQLLAGGWRVYAVSRRVPPSRADVQTAKLSHVAVDVAELDSVQRAFAGLSKVTHLFYCGNDSHAATRLRMLRNVLDAIEPAAPGLANVHLMQGTKYYGGHLGAFKVPAQESDPRISGADFYYSEEDFVRSRRHGKRWTWTALRPHAVCGYAESNPLNLAVVLGIYGTLCRALGRPLAFPASEACFNALFNVIDADLMARASIWCSTTPACGNEAFNVNNGDVFRWCELWPQLAECFELKASGPQPQSLPEFLAEHARLWHSVSERHSLKPFPYERVARWTQGDYTPPNSRFACEYDVVADLSKVRSFGFAERIDSGQMFKRMFERLRAEQVIP